MTSQVKPLLDAETEAFIAKCKAQIKLDQGCVRRAKATLVWAKKQGLYELDTAVLIALETKCECEIRIEQQKFMIAAQYK